MKPGMVFRWDDFPYPKLDSKIKARWFIYLGDTGPFSTHILVHLCTTTTKIKDFQLGGNRASHKHLVLNAEDTPFEEDCLIDFNVGPDSFPKQEVEGNPKIQVKGELQTTIIRDIYNGILGSRFYSKQVLMDIHASLNNMDIMGLRKPK